jgi:tight adherence protein C
MLPGIVTTGLLLACGRWRLVAWAVVLLSILARPVRLLVALLFGAVAYAAVRFRRRRREVEAIESEVTMLGELVALGLGAGLTFPGALARAVPAVAPSLRSEVEGVLRRARRDGAAAALEAATGHAARLYALSGRALATGAPLLPAVDAFVTERRDAERRRAQARVRRLPVRLMFPLAFLILPGFLLLTLGPALAGALERLEFPLPSVFGRPPM